MADKNEFEASAYLAGMRNRAFRVLYWLERAAESYDMNGGNIRELRLKAPTEGKPGWFAVVKGISEDGRAVVAFGGGPTPVECLDALRADSEGKGLRWRDDKPWQG